MATSSSSRRNAGASRGAAADTVAALALAVLIGCVGIDVPSAGPDVWVEPATGMRFVRVPAGSFTMGTPPGVPGREPEEIPHEVTLTRDFYLGQFEVTQAQWATVMQDNPSHFQACGPDCPVERVSWLDVQAFIAALEARAPDSRFRLPTEAEWEYACRAGTSTRYAMGDRLTTDLANFDGRYPDPGAPAGVSRGTPVPVGSFPPNGWGLYDMHGNVWEWTDDWHCPYPTGAAIDPRGVCEAGKRVIRGGSWFFDANSARCGLRYDHDPRDLGFSLGFRLVRVGQ